MTCMVDALQNNKKQDYDVTSAELNLANMF